jgi:hypothetical protein
MTVGVFETFTRLANRHPQAQHRNGRLHLTSGIR